jgi:hypothetical protein
MSKIEEEVKVALISPYLRTSTYIRRYEVIIYKLKSSKRNLQVLIICLISPQTGIFVEEKRTLPFEEGP